MDLRVLCVYIAVAYVDVSARITCNFQPKSWMSAMEQCLHQGGTPVNVSTVFSLTGLQLNGSFWTAEYVSRIATTESCVKNGTWKEASKCNEIYLTIPAQLPVGDYWDRGAFGYQINTYTGDNLQSLDRCGVLDVNGHVQFVSDCVTSQYSFCDVENYTGSNLSECGSIITTKQPSSNTPSFASQKTETLTATSMSFNGNTTTEYIVRNHTSSSSGTPVQQQTETLTATIMSINENTTTESIVRSHASTSSDSALSIGLGVSLSIVAIVIISNVGVCVYKRRKRNANCEGSRKEFGRTELGEIHVYDEISNNEESAYAASKVDIYDKIRTDGEQEHDYESVTSASKY